MMISSPCDHDEMDVPDLMGSCSSISHGSSSIGLSYHSCNSASHLDASFLSCTSGRQHAFQQSGVFQRKRNKAAKKIQSVVRGFLVRLDILKAPLLVELADIQRRQQEELERIERLKQEEMMTFQQEMETQFATLKETLANAKHTMTHLKEEKAHYEKDNATLKQQCKDLKKTNKKLSKDLKDNANQTVDMAMTQQRVTNLERHAAARQGVVDKYLSNIGVYQEKLQEANDAINDEQNHTKRLKECIGSIFDKLEARTQSESITKKLLKLAAKNQVFMLMVPSEDGSGSSEKRYLHIIKEDDADSRGA